MDPRGRALQFATTLSEPAEMVPHGGDLASARLRFPGAPEPWIDLSTGINPDAYPLPQIAPSAWTDLPQLDEIETLERVAGRRYRVQASEMVIAAAGTQALIEAIPRLIPTSQVAILGPTYGEHRAGWSRAGHSVREVQNLSEIGDARVVIIVNPNNPTGRVVPVHELLRPAMALERRQGLLVIDEAFADIVDSELSLAPRLPPATVVLRSFGKAYGLAGLRLGFAIAHPDIALRVRALLGPWPVSGPAIAVGTAALGDGLWLAETVKKLEGAVERLDTVLAASGAELVGGTPLFRLVRHDLARSVAKALGEGGILVRQFEYEPSWLRFGIPGSEEAWQRLTNGLAAARGLGP